MKSFSSKLALLFGSLGLMLTIFLIVVYYMHIYALPDVSIGAIRYMASTHSAAIAFFAFSFGVGVASLAIRGERKSSWLMLASALTAVMGYIFPCERLWTLGYFSTLSETVIIAAVHVTLLISSALLLKLKKARA